MQMNIETIRICNNTSPIGYVRYYSNGIRGGQRDE
jgi:hypothetical protein